MDCRHFAAGSLYEPPGREEFPLKMTRATGGQAFIYHWHSAVEVLLGLSGETVAGIADRPYRLAAGDILLIPPGESHCLFPSAAEDTRLVLLFEPDALLPSPPFSESRQALSGVPLHSGEWDAGTAGALRDWLFQMEAAFRQKRPGWKEETAGLALLLAARLCRLPPAPPQGGRLRQDDALKKVLSYLSAHYAGPVSLSSCAAALGFTPAYLSSFFKAKTGAAFHRYLLNLRLKKAEWLLASTALPAARVAEESGFASEKTFFRVFKEQYRMTPLQYRRKKTGQE